jgi:hypothetical protein
MKKDSLNITVDGYRISSVTYGDNGVKSITIDGGDENRNYSYEVTLTDEGLTVKPSILPKWHGSPISAEESDEPKEGDKCIFWSDGEAIMAIDTFTLNGAYIDGRHFCWRVGNNYFSHCVKYSDDKLIEIVNKLWQK